MKAANRFDNELLRQIQCLRFTCCADPTRKTARSPVFCADLFAITIMSILCLNETILLSLLQ